MEHPLKRARVARELSQVKLAELLGIAQSLVSKYENGEVTPSIDKAAQIAAVLGMSELELLYPERFGFVRNSQPTEARAA
jgi:transcriptional regulator with XRE-family HTH domain